MTRKQWAGATEKQTSPCLCPSHLGVVSVGSLVYQRAGALAWGRVKEGATRGGARTRACVTSNLRQSPASLRGSCPASLEAPGSCPSAPPGHGELAGWGLKWHLYLLGCLLCPAPPEVRHPQQPVSAQAPHPLPWLQNLCPFGSEGVQVLLAVLQRGDAPRPPRRRQPGHQRESGSRQAGPQRCQAVWADTQRPLPGPRAMLSPFWTCVETTG